MDPSKYFEDQMNQTFRKLSNDIIPTDETAKNVCTTNIVKLLQEKSRFKIGQICIAGSNGKRTTIFSSDVDCVLFINDMRPPFKDVLSEFCDILTLTDSFNIRDFRTTDYTIQFKANDFDFDMQPAANFFAHCQNETGDHLSEEQHRRTLDIIKADPDKFGYLYSGSLAKATVQFMKEQDGFTHEMVRLAKFWYKTLYIDEYVSGAKSAIELVAVYVAQKERNYVSASHLRCFGQVLKYLMKFDEMDIVFKNEYKFKEHQPLDDGKRPRLIDPVNPYNNFASNWSRTSIELIKCYANETNRRLQFLADGGIAHLNVLFDPQPSHVPILREVFPNSSHRSNWLGGFKDYHSSLPDLKVRNDKLIPVEKLAVVERITQLHKIVNGFTKHNFEIQLNRDVHSHHTRQSNDLRCPDKHPILKQATHEYNALCSSMRHIECMKTFKSKLKIVVMKNASDYGVVSPYFYLN